MEDFSAAIAAEPRFHDFYKRRGQALSALGDDTGALADLGAAAELSPDAAAAADALGDSAKIRQRLRDYRRAEADARVRWNTAHFFFVCSSPAAAAVEAAGGALRAAFTCCTCRPNKHLHRRVRAVLLSLQAALARTPGSLPLLSLLASCQVSQGNLEAGAATYALVLREAPDDGEATLNAGMAAKEMCHVARAEKVRGAAPPVCLHTGCMDSGAGGRGTCTHARSVGKRKESPSFAAGVGCPRAPAPPPSESPLAPPAPFRPPPPAAAQARGPAGARHRGGGQRPPAAGPDAAGAGRPSGGD